MKTAATLAGVTGLCIAGWLTVAAWTIDRASQTLYEWSDHE
ncbi:hypothetical protein [Rhodococcus sp. HM1]|nr:hypothetical protein [Rhodococcus sp. HM1]